MATTTRAPKYPCGLCGKRSTADRMIYSTHTGSRYCGSDYASCRARREARRKRGV